MRASKRIRFFVVVLIIVIVSTLASFANPKISTTWTTYSVTATTADGLKAQMRDRGPRGVWAITRWEVRWTTTCQVSLQITYMIPQHARPNQIPTNLRAKWDRMISALVAHEQKHGAHGMQAAHELVQNGCRNASAIVQKWDREDRLLDQRTGHGRTEGVRFP